MVKGYLPSTNSNKFVSGLISNAILPIPVSNEKLSVFFDFYIEYQEL